MAAEELQRAFKTLADPTRLRILTLLEREEFAVQELTQILEMAQSTVSRHLGILREAGLLSDRREGTWAYYRLELPAAGPLRSAWDLARRALDDDPTALRDRQALDRVLEARALRTRRWFDSVAPAWDELRRVFDDDTHRARAIAKLVPRELLVADIGTGTGILAQELARAGMRVIAVDHSQRMLSVARARLDELGLAGVELREGEANDLPLTDGETDAAFAHMVLQHVPSPAEVLREMSRVVRPGGRVVVVDFVQHDRDWMKEKLGVQWQGFPLDAVRRWFEEAGLQDLVIDVDPARAGDRELPTTFIAAATRRASQPIADPAETLSEPTASRR